MTTSEKPVRERERGSADQPPGGGPSGDGEIRAEPGKLRNPPARDWVIRFAFGAGVSALAGVVTALAGPLVGGLFLAFPAILIAGLTLVAKEEGVAGACDGARGAVLGTVGLLAFAVVVAFGAQRWPLWVTLLVACLVWAAVSLSAYGMLRLFGAGTDTQRSR